MVARPAAARNGNLAAPHRSQKRGANIILRFPTYSDARVERIAGNGRIIRTAF
jgi:hypothetical protein